MSSKFFGQFLLEKGIITRDVLLDAVEYQKSINLPLCALAVEKGYLTEEQLKALDAAETDADSTFVEVALANGMLNYAELGELSKAKSDRWVFFGEALVQRGHITLVELNRLFEEYRKEQRPAGIALENVLQGVPEEKVISSLVRATLDMFAQYTRQIIQIASVKAGCEELQDFAYVFSQKVTGDKPFTYALVLPEELTLSIAGYILQEAVSKIDELALDAVSEFVNVVIGNACTTLDMQDYKASAEPPRILLKDMYQDLLKSCDGVTVVMKTAEGEFNTVFLFSQGAA